MRKPLYEDFKMGLFIFLAKAVLKILAFSVRKQLSRYLHLKFVKEVIFLEEKN